MADRSIKRLQRLSCQGSSAPVCRRDGNDYGRIGELAEGIDGRFCIKGVETSFQEDQIDTPFYQRSDLLLVDGGHSVEITGAEGRVVKPLRKGEGLAGRADTPGDPYFPGRPVCRLPGDPGSGKRHLPGFPAHPVFFLRKTIGTERIGFDDIGTSLNISTMDSKDNLRIAQIESLAVPG